MDAIGENPAALAVMVGLALGLVFGVAAQISRFCLRNAITADSAEARRDSAAIWAAGFLTALLGTLALRGTVDFAATRYLATPTPLLAAVVGGLLFGGGMVLTRGCATRMLVLAGSGNLRSASNLLIFAIIAYATLKGVLATARGWLLVDAPVDTAAFGPLLAGLLAVSALVVLWRGLRRQLALRLTMGVVIGASVVAAWYLNGVTLQDEFEPRPADALSFTLAIADVALYAMLSSALTPNFGLGLAIGVVVGAHLSARLRGEFKWESFTDATQTKRHALGAVLMGFGGVVAGGCTIGAGLTGASALSFAAMVTLLAIAGGAAVTHRLVDQGGLAR